MAAMSIVIEWTYYVDVWSDWYNLRDLMSPWFGTGDEAVAWLAEYVDSHEDTTDEEDFTGEQKEIASEMQALRAAQQWVNQEGWDAAGEAKAVDSSGADVDLRTPTDAEGRPLTWGDVQRQLAKGASVASGESALTAAVVEEVVVRDFALEKLDPTQRVFADRVLAWGRDLVSAYKHNATVRDRRKLKRAPLLRSYLGGSAGSGKSTTCLLYTSPSPRDS